MLPDQPGLYPHELVAGGKQGTLYVVNRDSEGQFNSNTDNVVQELPKAVASELNGVPTYWNNSVYVAGESDHIKQFALVNGQLGQQPVSQTAISFTGFGPASTSMTANGNTNGILWAIKHTNPALYAFDATNLANEFWDSTQAAKARDKLVPVMRFVTPTISNGKVYVGGSAALAVYGLLQTLSVVTGNNQAGMEKAILPIPLTVEAINPYSSAAPAGVVVTCSDGSAGGVFFPKATQTTDASGTVIYSYQLPSRVRGITITCSSPGYLSAVFSEKCASGPPKSMTITSGNNQTAPPNAPLPTSLVVQVADKNGLGVPGVTVNFTDNGAGGTFVAASVVTGSNGSASAQYTMGPKAGSVTITASSSGLKSVSFAENAVTGPAANVSVTGGNNQSGTVATQLAQALTVLVTDSYNNPVSGVSVSFSDGGAGGTFSSPNPVVTGSNGTAAQSYTLPTLASSISITATATGVSSPATFTENSVAGPPTAIAVNGGNNQSGTAGTKLSQALSVLVTDQYHNPVSGVNVAFSDGGAGGTFSNSNPVATGSNGTATQFYTLPTLASAISITATAAGVSSPAVFAENSLAGPAASIAVTGGNNQAGPAGTALQQALTVLVTDQYHNPVSGVSVSFSDGGAGGAFANPNPGVTNSSGIATQTYTLPPLAGTITITAAATGVTNPAVFAENSVAGPAANIVIASGNNQSAAVATQLPQALTVVVTDHFGNPVSGVSVSFSDGGVGGSFSNPNPGTTDGTGSVTQFYTLPTIAGVISITATASGVANSAIFTETAIAGAAHNIAITSGNNQTAPNGSQLPLPLVVLVTDQYNNPVSGVSVTFSDGGVGGIFSNPNPTVTANDGTASQMYTLPAVAGETVYITATAAGIANPVTFTEYGQ